MLKSDANWMVLRFVPRFLVVIALLAGAWILGGCQTVTQSQTVGTITTALNNTADAVDAHCGTGTPEAQAARDAASNVSSKHSTYQQAAQKVNDLKNKQIKAAERIHEIQVELNPYDHDIAQTENRVVERINGNLRGHERVFEKASDVRIWADRYPNGGAKNLQDGQRLASRVNNSAVATDAQKTEAAALLAELNQMNQDIATQAESVKNLTQPGDNSGNDQLKASFSIMLALVERSRLALLKLEKLQMEIELVAQQQRRDAAAAEEPAAQAAYNTAKSELDQAISDAESARDAARAKANSCAPTPPDWPTQPDWNSTFWDFSSP